jgi:spermidine synthase
MAAIEGCVYHTLQNNFRFTDIVPGDRDYFIASDEPVTHKIASLALNRSIENKYVNEYYMDDRLISQRSENIKNNLSLNTPVNSDFKPIPVFLHSLHFIKVFNRAAPFLLALPVVFLILPVFFMKPVTAGIYSAGFTASSIEILIIFLFQAIFGYIYSAIGLIIAFFMCGLAAGSFAGYFRLPRKEHLVSGQFFLAVYAALFPVIAFVLYFDFSHVIKYLIFIIVTLLISVTVGFQFAAGTRIRTGPVSNNAAVLYAADLVGSSLGIIVITVILLPLLGLRNSCFLIAGINLIAMLNMIFRKSG